MEINIIMWRKYSVNDSKFDIKNPIFMYYAGLVVTDGYIDSKNNRVSLRFSLEEAESLFQKFKEHFEFEGNISKYKKSCDITIVSRPLLKVLQSIGASGVNKTFTLEFPKDFHNETCERMYLRGVFDGDGNIHRSWKREKWVGGQYRVVTGSEKFISGLIDFVNKKFGFNYSMSFHKVKGKSYPKLEMKVKDSKTFVDWFYQDYPEYKLQHKHDKYLSTQR